VPFRWAAVGLACPAGQDGGGGVREEEGLGGEPRVGAWAAPSGAPACRVPPRAPPRLGARASCRAAAGVAATSLHAATHSHGAAGACPAARAGAAEDPCCAGAGAGVSSCRFPSDSSAGLVVADLLSCLCHVISIHNRWN